MAEENKETKVTFKEKFKKAFPWIAGIGATIGGSVLGYKFGKLVATPTGHEHDDEINKYLLNAVNDVSRGIKRGVMVMDETGKETYAEFNVVDTKPDWMENAYEDTNESFFCNTVTSVSTKVD